MSPLSLLPIPQTDRTRSFPIKDGMRVTIEIPWHVVADGDDWNVMSGFLRFDDGSIAFVGDGGMPSNWTIWSAERKGGWWSDHRNLLPVKEPEVDKSLVPFSYASGQ